MTSWFLIFVIATTVKVAESHGGTDFATKACDAYEIAAGEDNAFAQGELGNCYMFGVGRKRDYELAINWYQKAVAQGNTAAMLNLGAAYLFYSEQPAKHQEAVELLNKAASAAPVKAKFSLALAFHRGLGVPRNNEKAVELLKEISLAGNPLPSLILYAIYELGLYEVPRDSANAETYKRKFLDLLGSTSPEEYILSLREDKIVTNFALSEEQLTTLAALARTEK